MNKRLLKYFWALPLLGMMSSCSESAVSEGSQNSKNGVYFAVTASKQTTTKAAAVDKDLVKTKNFGLFAYHGTDWATLLNSSGTGPTIVPNFMNNQVVTYSNDGGWGYTPLMYWLDDKISFFGYWPKEDGVTLASAAENEMPKVEFTQKMDAANMVDFITSYAVDKTKDGGKVTLDFHHVLTRLNFMARADRDLRNSGTSIYITGLRVLGSTDNNASKFFNKATFVLGDGGTDGDGHWLIGDADAPAPTKQADKLDVDAILAKTPDITSEVIDEETSAAYAANAVVVNEDGSETELLDKGGVTYADQTSAQKQHYLFMIPPRGKYGIKDDDIKVELDYDVVIKNSSLGNKGVVYHRKNQRVSLKEGTLVQGKPYNVVFTVGLNPVEVDVDVTDWDTDEIVNAPSVDATSNSEADFITAWSKLNTIKASLKAGDNDAANYFVINVENKPTGSLDLRTNVDAGKVDLSAFETGDQVELLFADDKDGTGYNTADNVSVPNGWVCEDRMVNGVKRHIMTKVANYITEVAASPYDAAKIITALSALNTKKGDIANKNIHYYAVNLYTTAPETIDLSSVVADNLSNFKDTNQDYLYIIYNTTDGNSGKTLTAPDGWTLTQTNVKGKYRLQRKVVSQTSNIAIGNTGFVAGSTINVSK